MIELILGQVRFLLLSVCLGMGLMSGYELLHIVRWFFYHTKWLIWIEDIFYWCFAAIPAFIVLFVYNDGVIRWYGMLATLGGGILYEKGLGRPVRTFLARKLWNLRRKWERRKKERKEIRQKRKESRQKQREAKNEKRTDKSKEKTKTKREQTKQRGAKKSNQNRQ